MGNVNKFNPGVEVKQRLRALYQKDNWHWLLAVLADVAVIVLAVYFADRYNILYPLAILFIGSRQRALASLLHEAAHMTLTQSKQLNKIIGEYLLGYPIFQNYEAYRRSHVQLHHHNLGDPDKDPDHRYYIESGLYNATDRFDFLIGHLLKSLTLANTYRYFLYLVKNRAGDVVANPSQGVKLLATHAVLLLVFSYFMSPWAYVLFWLVPYFTVFQVIGWLSEVSEHFGRFGVYKEEVELTRNRFPALLERLIIGMHGDNYHLTHHLFAGIPFWNLKKAHDVLMDDERYAAANRGCGGIFTAKGDAKSCIGQIFEAYRSGTISAVFVTE
ncbi:MAG: guanitoxin biosynthesis L-arginine gamma (S) hydroxylase [Pseudomonas fluorescens]|jgi:fatty acid desaturase|uniref:guanitoxin biosynthesis L-arginine gamma (S) hydroxylase n=1 Tax=Pseudomonas TaxID=286 RepID=UPI000937A835|nr:MULTISPECIES: guanitoxin biosynthesis L-arginine gamma (S) hydroxylase [Pseudomonas]MBC8784909.1 fatty acid desaturase family protein [Pseudomonas fluorescens]MBK5545457.1 fatty acid desaturase family protein [Pseudomonas sp. TH04]UEL24076.1 fatty acid desaturase family protein [Pseudomonas fluorescens]WLH74659.1 guanitoxin biosynthesis L-arginine gamma (S) hydroxylase [Pseudomonas fluorescens]